MRLILLAMMMTGCATQPLTYEQQAALMGVAVGMQQFGQSVQENAYRGYQAPVPVYDAIHPLGPLPAVAPPAPFVPIPVSHVY
jgi:hypothetical protein